jgi:hypothetical protein
MVARERRTIELGPELLVENWPQLEDLVVDRTGRSDARDPSHLSGKPADTFRAAPPPSPNYLEGIELVNRAAEAMKTMEDHSLQIQTKAFELMQQARTTRLESSQQIAELQQRLIAAEMKRDELADQLAQAEQRAKTAEEWLGKFVEAVHTGFAARRACQADKVRSAA